jgi:phosphate transport system substrate-binding protein
MLLLLAVVVAAVLYMVFHGAGRNRRVVNVVGSTSIQPFAEILAEEFNSQGAIDVEVQGGGSTQGVTSALNGTADIGTCSRNLKDQEREEGLTPVTIAYDGLAVVVNPANGLDNLTRQQVRDIFTGTVTDWGQVGGQPGPIRVITREEGSGTREAFTGMIMGDHRISRKAITQPSNGTVKELVRHDPNAIGYMSLGIVEASPDLKALKIDGVVASVDNVTQKTYKLVRPFLFLVKGTPADDAQKFIDYVLGPSGQAKLRQEGLIPAAP